MPFELFVNGTLMRGLALHENMGDSKFIGEFRTEPRYRVHSINDVHPGMYRLNDGEEGGVAVAGELYLVSEDTWQQIEEGEPENLYRGKIVLDDGREVFGILYPRELAEGKQLDISAYGDWRRYVNAQPRLKQGASKAPANEPAPATTPGEDEVTVFAIGLHMSGMPRNHEFKSLGGRFLRASKTAPRYRLYELDGFPGMIKATSGGAAIEGELWAVPHCSLGLLLVSLPAQLALGRVELEDGPSIACLCGAADVEHAPEITHSGGWRKYLGQSSQPLGTLCADEPVDSCCKEQLLTG